MGYIGSLELLVYLAGRSSLSESTAYPSLAFFQPSQDTRLPKSQFILSCQAKSNNYIYLVRHMSKTLMPRLFVRK